MMASCHFLAFAKSKPRLVKLGSRSLLSFAKNLYMCLLYGKDKKKPHFSGFFFLCFLGFQTLFCFLEFLFGFLEFFFRFF